MPACSEMSCLRDRPCITRTFNDGHQRCRKKCWLLRLKKVIPQRRSNYGMLQRMRPPTIRTCSSKLLVGTSLVLRQRKLKGGGPSRAGMEVSRQRAEEGRVGRECVSTVSSRWTMCNEKQKFRQSETKTKKYNTT